jgi:RNA polymerase sigma-70 factor (ECF subfamily)
VTWLQPFPDVLLDRARDRAPGPEAEAVAREAVELAFIAALQRLPPRQAAALVLCDVLDCPRAEAASMLGVGPTVLKGLLQRARASLERHRGQRVPPPAPESAAERSLVRRFADAFAADDFDALVGLLTDDAWLAMPPAPHEYHGAAAISAFLRVSAAWSAPRRLLMDPLRANGQPAFACRFSGPVQEPAGLIVLTLAADRIQGVTRFLDHRSMSGGAGLSPACAAPR